MLIFYAVLKFLYLQKMMKISMILKEKLDMQSHSSQ